MNKNKNYFSSFQPSFLPSISYHHPEFCSEKRNKLLIRPVDQFIFDTETYDLCARNVACQICLLAIIEYLLVMSIRVSVSLHSVSVHSPWLTAYAERKSHFRHTQRAANTYTYMFNWLTKCALHQIFINLHTPKQC